MKDELKTMIYPNSRRLVLPKGHPLFANAYSLLNKITCSTLGFTAYLWNGGPGEYYLGGNGDCRNILDACGAGMDIKMLEHLLHEAETQNDALRVLREEDFGVRDRLEGRLEGANEALAKEIIAKISEDLKESLLNARTYGTRRYHIAPISEMIPRCKTHGLLFNLGDGHDYKTTLGEAVAKILAEQPEGAGGAIVDYEERSIYVRKGHPWQGCLSTECDRIAGIVLGDPESRYPFKYKHENKCEIMSKANLLYPISDAVARQILDACKEEADEADREAQK